LDKPGSLTDPGVYALAAWLLYRNNIINVDGKMNAETLSQVRMPNRNGFLPDPRPDVREIAGREVRISER
jgi:cytochrome c